MEQIGPHSVYSIETEAWGPLFTFTNTSPLWFKSVQKTTTYHKYLKTFISRFITNVVMITLLTSVTSIPTVAAVRRKSQQVLALQTFSNILLKLCKIYITTVLQPQIIPPVHVLISYHQRFLQESCSKIFKKNNLYVKR